MNLIREIRERMGSELLILGHYYQDAEILKEADVVGDSYQLAVAASQSRARFIVLCGVHFMAESALILTGPGQRVFIPDPSAGCPLADTITAVDFPAAMEALASLWKEAPVPLLYVNSTAALKALVGQAGGLCCTSSNAATIASRLLREKRRIFMAPDKNLAANVAASLGKECAVWPGGPALRTAPIAAWNGFCPIHQCMTLKDLEKARRDQPGCRILVHPECIPEVVRRADFYGSTSQIHREVQAAASGSTLVIGTEAAFVRWAAALRPDITVLPLRKSRCADMARITPSSLLATLRRLEEDASPMAEEVVVEPGVRAAAAGALKGMIEYTEAPG